MNYVFDLLSSLRTFMIEKNNTLHYRYSFCVIVSYSIGKELPSPENNMCMLSQRSSQILSLIITLSKQGKIKCDN